jgi:hypothetical protein
LSIWVQTVILAGEDDSFVIEFFVSFVVVGKTPAHEKGIVRYNEDDDRNSDNYEVGKQCFLWDTTRCEVRPCHASQAENKWT